MKSIITFLLTLTAVGVSLAQRRIASVWQLEAAPTELVGTRMILPSAYQSFYVSLADLRTQLVGLPLEADVISQRLANSALPVFALPMADGSVEEFAVFESPCMEDGLAAKFPSIKTYRGTSVQHPEATVRFDVTPLGFHATVWFADHTIYIDPITPRDINHYIVYDKKNYSRQTAPMMCQMKDETSLSRAMVTPNSALESNVLTSAKRLVPPTTGPTLRTYRLALACTGEYSEFHNTAAGTTNNTAIVLSAMTTSINRVNGVYEREVAIKFTLVANNNLLVFHDANTDGFTNNNGLTLLSENQQRVDSLILPANYDIGHVFSTGGGGVADLGCVCGPTKAQGVTGSSAPVGDPFDIDYVTHEIGHQFSANHTFNSDLGSCGRGNREAANAFEPGSGVTIMAYANLCQIDNIATSSIDIMHTATFDEITTYAQNGRGNNCPVRTQSGNRTPVATTDATVYTIPLNTPFELTGSGTDADGDAMTYCWEQMDNDSVCRVDQPIRNAPLFRTFYPTTSPNRTFPKLETIAAGALLNFGEILPTYARDMNFRMTVRDNHALCGGVTYSTAKVVASAVGTNFIVTSQQVSGIAYLQTFVQEITWNVANTTAAPISAAMVDIFLSTDGGLTYPTVIATNVPNNGSYDWTVNGAASTTCRVKVKAKGNVFFDINDVNFEIQAYVSTNSAAMLADKVLVYPNPARNELNVSLKDINGAVNITLCDVTGKVMTTLTANGSTRINTSDYAAGVYIINVQTNEGVYNGKVVIGD